MDVEGLKQEKRKYRGSLLAFVQLICPICGKERWIRKGLAKYHATLNCCSCANRIKTKFLPGSDHIMWKNGRDITGRYIRLRISGLNEYDKSLAIPMAINTKEPRISEHRLVMARKLGRPLKRHEIVRHLNGNKHDNRPKNLELGSAYDNTHDHMDLLNENKRLKELIVCLRIALYLKNKLDGGFHV